MTGGRRILALAAVVVLNAGVQATLVALAPRDPLSGVGLGTAVASVVALVVVAWLVARWTSPARPSLGWGVVAALAVGLAAIAVPAAVPVVVVIGALVLAAGTPAAAVRVVRGRPGRSVGWAVITIVAVVVGWVAALVLGLLVGDAVGSAVTWLLVGALAVLVAGGWGSLVTSARPAPSAAEPRPE